LTNYWIFVVTDQDKMTAKEIYDTLMDAKQWGLGEKTPNRKNLEKDDSIVFYQAGQNAQQFLGTAKLAAQPIKLTESEKEKRKELGRVFDSDYAVDLTEINKWIEPKPVKSIIGQLEFIIKKDVYYAYFQGGIRAISGSDYNIIVSPTTIVTQQLKVEGETVNEVQFGLETHLQEFMISNWEKINFGYKLKLFKDAEGNNGENYPTPIGYMDILAVDEKNNDFVVIELKKGKESDKVVGQIQRYMGWARKNLAGKNQNVRGIIITKEYDEKLFLAASENPNIILKYYHVKFHLADKAE